MDIASPLLNRYLKKTVPQIEVGDVVRVHQKIREGNKERIQVFEGIVIAKHQEKSLDATFTVRKIASGVGVERVYLIHSPNIVKIEFKRSSEVRRAKLYYLRDLTGKALKLKDKKKVKENWEELVGAPAETEAALEPTEEEIAEAVAAQKEAEEVAVEPTAEATEAEGTSNATIEPEEESTNQPPVSEGTTDDNQNAGSGEDDSSANPGDRTGA